MSKHVGPVSLWEILEGITENLRSKRLADVFRFISFSPFESYGPHSHQRIEINYVKKGTCIIRQDDESTTFRKGEMMVITSNVSHYFEAGPEGATLMQLEFLPEIFSQLDFCTHGGSEGGAKLASAFLSSEENDIIKIVNNAPIKHAVQCIINELNSRKSHYQHLVVMYYAELLVLICRYMEDSYLPICTNEPLKKAIAYIRQNCCSDIDISHIAEHAGISQRYLRRLFARHIGMPPLDYLNQMRVGKAVDLLRNTDMLIKEVCFRCGFKSPQYFSRVFKQQIGVSPNKMGRQAQ